MLIALVASDVAQVFESAEPSTLLNRVMNILKGIIHLYFFSIDVVHVNLYTPQLIHPSACPTNKQQASYEILLIKVGENGFTPCLLVGIPTLFS